MLNGALLGLTVGAGLGALLRLTNSEDDMAGELSVVPGLMYGGIAPHLSARGGVYLRLKAAVAAPLGAGFPTPDRNFRQLRRFFAKF